MLKNSDLTNLIYNIWRLYNNWAGSLAADTTFLGLARIFEERVKIMFSLIAFARERT